VSHTKDAEKQASPQSFADQYLVSAVGNHGKKTEVQGWDLLKVGEMLNATFILGFGMGIWYFYVWPIFQMLTRTGNRRSNRVIPWVLKIILRNET